MSALQRLPSGGQTLFEGWRLDTSDAEEPRVRDLEIAERAGLNDLHSVRRTIERNWSELTSHGEIRVSDRRSETSDGRPAVEYWLTEAQAVSLVSMMRTPQARALRVAMVKLFIAYRRGLLAPPPPTSTIDMALVHGVRVGDIPAMRADLAEEVAIAARASGASVHAVHGAIRRAFRIASIYHLSAVLLEQARRILRQLATGRLLVAPPRRKGPSMRLAPATSNVLRLSGF